MAILKAFKVVSALPGTLLPDTAYFIRTGAGFDLKVSDSTGAIAHALNTSDKIKATLTNSAVIAETVIASFAIPANFGVDDLLIKMFGQASANGSLTFRLRFGTTGTTADALLAQFTPGAALAAGTNNTRSHGDILVSSVGTNQIGAGGQIQLISNVVGIATGVFAPLTINPAVANFLTITVAQSIVQTYTCRAAMLVKL